MYGDTAFASSSRPRKGAIRLKPDAELMPNAPQLFRDLRRYETFDKTNKPGGWSAADVGKLSIDEMREHGSCLVIVNTKRDALAIYAQWKEQLKTLEEPMEYGCLVHLSTHMCPAHRLEALNRMKAALAPQSGKRVLCVSTQLIEAGVDIDFATVVRDLAGLDSIAQAAGRCNRNGERATGRVHIVKMAQALPKTVGGDTLSRRQMRGGSSNDWREEKGNRPFRVVGPAGDGTLLQASLLRACKSDGLSGKGSSRTTRRHPSADAWGEWHGGRRCKSRRRHAGRADAVVS